MTKTRAPIKVAIPQQSTLLLYSGGLDSLGALWMLLQRKVAVHVHHVDLRSIEGRWIAELEAVSATLKWLRANGYSFTSGSSVFMMDAYRGGFLYDSDVYNLIGGGIATLSRGAVTQVAIGATKDDDVREGRAELQRGRDIYSLITDVPKTYPVAHMTKQEIWDMLPPELRKLAWSCRTPINTSSAFGIEFLPCGICKPCRAMTAIHNAPSN